MEKLIIFTQQYQKKYFIDNNNYITTEDYKTPSKQWILFGFKHKRRNETLTIDEYLKLDNNKKFYKNKKSQYYVVDIDNNTQRIWVQGNEICGIINLAE